MVSYKYILIDFSETFMKNQKVNVHNTPTQKKYMKLVLTRNGIQLTSPMS